MERVNSKPFCIYSHPGSTSAGQTSYAGLSAKAQCKSLIAFHLKQAVPMPPDKFVNA